jgi:nitric oxide dioxygenase
MLSPDVIATIKATIPALSAHGELLTRHFYRRMFDGNPEVRAFFNPAHQHSGGQQRALAAAICAYAQNIEDPAALAGAVELIAQKHASLGVRPEHYPVVGRHLLASIREVLGAAATDDVIHAWGQAYQVLADILIAREAEIYGAHREAHGWDGMTELVVRRKQRESDTVTSFYLGRADGKPLGTFRAGQYVTVRVGGADGWTTMRNYSLSGPPGAPYWRISVKREGPLAAAAPAGHVSNYLHDYVGEGDRIEVGPPCGEFVLGPPSAPGRPLVLISGGVGVTPVLSMLHAALAAEDDRPVWFIHGALNGDTHAFGEEVRSLAARHPRLRVHVRYCTPARQDRQLQGCDSEGFIDVPLLRSLLGTPDADVYFCGPKPFMASLHAGLLNWGVPAPQLHYEFFGPAEALAAAAEPEAAVA